MNEIILKNIVGNDVSITIVDDEKHADFITHSGTFHADEVMATVILLNKFGKLKLFRTSNPTNDNAFTYDVGFGKYDHHGIDFDYKRENGIKYASCGLIWKAFGNDIVSKLDVKDVDSFMQSIDKNLIMDIDRDDNGQNLGVDLPVKLQTIPSLIGSFNPSWNAFSNENECFLDAVSFSNKIFNNMLNRMLSKEAAREIIEKKIEDSMSGVLILDKYMPWKDIVLSSNNPKAKDILYAIFPSKRGGYNIVATPISSGSFDVKKPFPCNWAGKEGKELQDITGIKTINFCHKGLFICACSTLEDAKLISKIAINN